ncbi:unnamed protein product [Linum trigynum]|uniref:Uncharacterized protein n=1 Tax=Linum trigynum TaxID=586398 RepID=A0AAV2CI32_9ROSI
MRQIGGRGSTIPAECDLGCRGEKRENLLHQQSKQQQTSPPPPVSSMAVPFRRTRKKQKEGRELNSMLTRTNAVSSLTFMFLPSAYCFIPER